MTMTVVAESVVEPSIHDRQMIILYYCYPPTSIPTEKLESHASFHRAKCQQLTLGGRIRVSTEGINGVLSGREEDLRTYDAELRKELMMILYNHDQPSSCCLETNNDGMEEDPTKEWLDMKYCHLRKDIPEEKQLFDSLSVKITKEVVSLIEPVSVTSRGNENKGRARCRQRRKQRRREKLISAAGGVDDEVCEDTEDPINVASSLSYQEVKSTPTSQEYGMAVQIQDWEKCTPAIHLSPREWNDKLLQHSKEKAIHDDNPENCNNNSDDVILLDARNIYETRIGHFAAPKIDTLFPNTRKFSSLPQALNTEQAASALAGKQVFMYCTGGVRCERAGSYLRALSESNSGAWKGKDRPKAIYQLRGGIQNYLATFGKEQHQLNDENPANAATTTRLESEKTCLYRGKNFVFDPRRTDPVIGEGITNADDFSAPLARLSLVGHCIICTSPHDDYDNGHCPAEEKEARCCRCRVLVLVCNNCRQRVRCWGEPEDDSGSKPNLFCGNSGVNCVDEGNVAEKVEIAQY